MLSLESNRKALVRILQMAYSGEKAAALAYAGHWRACKNIDEKADIARIEGEEWEHRRIVGTYLDELGEKPQLWREILMSAIGSIIFPACFLSGWYLPMYVAGLLESDNVNEYLQAARHAEACGFHEIANHMLKLALVEKSHEEFFMSKIRDHEIGSLSKLAVRLVKSFSEPKCLRIHH